jgi:hypothetical protein
MSAIVQIVALALQVILVPLIAALWKSVGDRLRAMEDHLASLPRTYVSQDECRKQHESASRELLLIIEPLRNDIRNIWGNGAIGKLREEVGDLRERVSALESKRKD